MYSEVRKTRGQHGTFLILYPDPNVWNSHFEILSVYEVSGFNHMI